MLGGGGVFGIMRQLTFVHNNLQRTVLGVGEVEKGGWGVGYKFKNRPNTSPKEKFTEYHQKAKTAEEPEGHFFGGALH